MTHTAKVTINADITTTWDAITENGFVKDFLPEVQKDITGMGEYVQRTHQNATRVMPAQVTPGQFIAWTTQAGTRIELPRQDTQANIQAVEIQLKEKGVFTEVTIEVNYNPDMNTKVFETRRCLKGLFGIKLNVLKNDLEAEQHMQWAPAFT